MTSAKYKEIPKTKIRLEITQTRTLKNIQVIKKKTIRGC